jgi:hypothetical protein
MVRSVVRLAVLLSLFLPSSAAYSSHEDCTHGGAGSDIVGTDGADTCNGTSAGENMFARAGGDRFVAFGGFDDVHGQVGPDFLNESTGSGAVEGDKGDDRINGNDGDDNLLEDLPSNIGDHDHACDGPGNDFINIRDGDGLDTWYNYPDGDAEFDLVRDTAPGPMDDISDNNTNCPRP